MTLTPSGARPAPLRHRWRRAVGVAAVGAMVAGPALVVVTVAPATAATGGVCVYGFTGGEQSWVVPAGVTSTTVTAIGATPRGERPEQGGGPGARVTATLSGLVPGSTLYLEVGGEDGWNGGGAGGSGRGSDGVHGGGASDVRTVSRTASGTLTSRLLVAGGGGGDAAGPSSGGEAGGTGGFRGFGNATGGQGGSATAGGAGGAGASGYVTRPGETYRPGDRGGDGQLGQGGDGAFGFERDTAGGGGGGGYYGGGGGGGGGYAVDSTGRPTYTDTGAGGGGGSSYGPAGAQVLISGEPAAIKITDPTMVPPSAPRQPQATADNRSAQLSWTPPADDGGCAVTSYTITPYDVTGGQSVAGRPVTVTGTTATVTGLTEGRDYRFGLVANNPAGSSGIATTGSVRPFSDAGFTGTPPDAAVDQPYDFSFTPSGYPAASLSVTGGALPPGLSLSSAGQLSGTPTATGDYSFEVTATNGAGAAQRRSFTLTVKQSVPGAPTGVTATAGPSWADVSWTAPAYTGIGPVTGYTVTARDTTDQSAATVTTTTTGTSTTVTGLTPGHDWVFTVVAANAAGRSEASSASAPVTPYAAPGIGAAPVPDAVVGSAYRFEFTATGYPAPTFSVLSGALPPGLDLSPGGVLSGRPTTAGSYDFTVRAANGRDPAATRNVTLTVTATRPGAPTGVTATAGNTSADVAWTAPSSTGGSPLTGYTVTARDTTDTSAATVTRTTTGTSVTVSGLTPGHAWTFTVAASNAVGAGPDSAPSDPVTPYSSPTIGGTPPDGTAGAAYSFAFDTGGSPAPTVSATGALPPGLTLSPAGVLSGTPTTAGSYDFTVVADNGRATPARRAVTVKVVAGQAAAVSATGGSGQAGTAGQPFADPLVATVTDAYGNPVAGQRVTFTVVSGSASFAGPATTSTVVTNADGQATSSVLTAGRTSGPVRVTASAGSATTATYSLTVLSVTSARADLQVSVTAPSTVQRGKPFTATVTVRNAGPNAASATTIGVDLGPGLLVSEAKGAAVTLPSAVLYRVPGLASGATVSYTVTVKPVAFLLPGTWIKATALSAVPDPRLTNNLAAAGIRLR